MTRMWSIVIFLFVFSSKVPAYETCQIKFNNLDSLNTTRYIYEQQIFNITGLLENCPSTLSIRNISVANPVLKRLSILNVTYVIETNQIHVTGLARLLGFAPLTIELYFQKSNLLRSRSITPFPSKTRFKRSQCAISSSNHDDILRKCSSLTYKRGYYVLTEKITVAVKRHQTVIDALFTGVVMFLVTFGTLCIGCDLEFKQMTNNFKRPIPLLIGLACQIIYLPVLAWILTKIFKLENSSNLGLISTASSPGGGSSNIYTALLGGDVDLSVTMTFFSTIVAFGTFPLWIWLLGKEYVDFVKTKFPWWSMFLSLITLFIPAIVGVLLRRYRPVLAFRIGRFLNPIAVGYLVFILTFGVYINMYIFYIINVKEVIACCFLPWFGFIGGALISLVSVRDRKKTIAVCIETGIQNTAVAIFFLRLTFPQPESDIALANPILVSMAIPIPFLVLVLVRSILKRFAFLQRCFPERNQKKKGENGTNLDNPEKLIIEELLEEKEKEKEQEQSLPTEKSPL